MNISFSQFTYTSVFFLYLSKNSCLSLSLFLPLSLCLGDNPPLFSHTHTLSLSLFLSRLRFFSHLFLFYFVPQHGHLVTQSAVRHCVNVFFLTFIFAPAQSFNLVIVIGTVPAISAIYAKCIKVTVDGPREPRSKISK